MQIMVTDDKPRSYSQYPAPPPPMHHRMSGPEGPPGLSAHPTPQGPPVAYEQPWRYHNSYEGHDSRRTSGGPQPPVSHAMTFPPMQGPPQGARDLPTIHSNSPYDRPPPPNYPPMNGTPQESSPLSAPPEYRARMPFTPQDQPPLTNGDLPLPPQSLPQPIPQNPYPVTAPPPVSHTPTPVDANYPSSLYMRQQRKATRAQQACDQCRSRKAKCDEGRPACSHCKENNLTCVYKEQPPHKQDKNVQSILDKCQNLEDSFIQAHDESRRMQSGIERLLDTLIHKMDGLDRSITGRDYQPSPQHDLLRADGSHVPNPDRSAVAHHETERQRTEAFERSIMNQTQEDGELSIPVEHTTAAHKLLNWGLITKLLRGYDTNYVMKLEDERGTIRLTGRGEDKPSDGLDLPPIPQPASFNSSMEDTYSQNTSPTTTWSTNTKYNDAPTEVRGIDEFGMVSIDAETVQRYLKNYLENIHKLHPFLDRYDLERKIDEFIAKHCPKSGESPSRLSATQGAKRKRSSEARGYAQEPPSLLSDGTSPQRVEKTKHNAIILLVLALGRVCEVRDEPIRGPCTDHIIDYRHEPIPQKAHEHEYSSVPETFPVHSSFQSPYQSHSASPASGIDDKYVTLPDPPHLENIDTVPGLVYYKYATYILGESCGATGLLYAQAALLAGLYMGQLARPYQSHAWIHAAGTACQRLVADRVYGKLPQGSMKDLVCFAFWTCLQLESDILAELDLPASGITRKESVINLPRGEFTNPASDVNMIMFYYSAQTHLRKVLNRVHTDLYKVEKPGTKNWGSGMQGILSMNLGLWRTNLPAEMAWQDHDPPSPDINVARMRAKYYGARYIIHRPLLYHALHHFGQYNQGQPITSPVAFPNSGTILNQMSPSAGQDMTRVASNLSAPPFTTKTYRDLPRQLRKACKECLDSAILSTVAFDGVPGRPIVTNIFGTAHAQFGNMLVLSAAYNSILTELVNRDQLERLLKRTIAFLLRNRNISPTLRADAKILTDIYEKIFGPLIDVD